ncbi:MAG: CoA transferase [Chloroflexi bacterium]|nr:CoA transferase [Chloroflexota bacterium]
MYSLLRDIRVLECTASVAGAYCGRLLADAGTDVVKVERPLRGDASRHTGPFPKDSPNLETSLLFQYVNAGKRGVTLDTATLQGAALLKRLIPSSDVVIEERPGGCVEQAGLGVEDVRQANPRAVVLTLSPFGQHGSKRGWKGHSLNVEHASGMGWLTPTGLARRMFPNRQPLKMGGHISEYFVAFTAATGVIVGLLARMASGRGQHIDLSSQDALVSLERGPISIYANQGALETPLTRDFPYGGCYPCADGYVEILAHEDHHWAGLVAMVERPEWSQDPAFAQRPTRVTRAAEINNAIEAWTRQHSRQEIYQRGVRHGVPVGIFSSPTEVVASEHERVRGFFRPLVHPFIGKTAMFPASPFVTPPAPEQGNLRAPMLGEHNEQVYCGALGLSRQDLVALREARVI